LGLKRVRINSRMDRHFSKISASLARITP
jgi:hypothetical protein